MATNGRLDLSTLVLVDGWAYLEARTAAAYNAACDKMQRLGFARPSITAPDGAYRDYPGQVFWKKYWCDRKLCGNAATPGTSNHGLGRAIDLWQVYLWPRTILRSVFAEFGFVFDVPSEPWHARHDGRTIPGYALAAGSTPLTTITEPEQDEDMTTFYAPTESSSPLPDGVSRIWAGEGREVAGVRFSNVWGIADTGEGRRLTRRHWEDINKRKPVPVVPISGNELEQIIYGPRL